MAAETQQLSVTVGYFFKSYNVEVMEGLRKSFRRAWSAGQGLPFAALAASGTP
jgi:hypothetical protein